MLGEGQVKLELSLVNFLVLDGVYHIYNFRKNLIGKFLLLVPILSLIFGFGPPII